MITQDVLKQSQPLYLCQLSWSYSRLLSYYQTFKQLTKEAKLIYCFLEAHCSTAGFLQADESDIANGIGLEHRPGLNPFGNIIVLAMKELENSGFIAQGDHDFILVKGTHKKRAYGKLKVSDKAKDYYRVGVLKSGMHTAVLEEINITCDLFLSGGDIRGVWGYAVWFIR